MCKWALVFQVHVISVGYSCWLGRWETRKQYISEATAAFPHQVSSLPPNFFPQSTVPYPLTYKFSFPAPGKLNEQLQPAEFDEVVKDKFYIILKLNITKFNQLQPTLEKVQLKAMNYIINYYRLLLHVNIAF